MSRWLDPVLDLLFPAVCPVCDARSDDPVRRPFCARCWGALPLVREAGCRVCGRSFPGLPPDLACDTCRRAPPPFACLRAAGYYRDGLRTAIHALKYGRRTALASPLAALLAGEAPRLLPGGAAGEFPGERFDAVVAVPLHPARLAERGFNQAELLAAPCAAAWGRPLLARALVRTRPTRPQTELDAAARRENVAGAFRVVRPRDVTGRRLLLVDDVLTTGATARAVARALRRGGAAAVSVLVLARVGD